MYVNIYITVRYLLFIAIFQPVFDLLREVQEAETGLVLDLKNERKEEPL